jgi:hypothetical protein
VKNVLPCLIIPFGAQVYARAPDERTIEEVYTNIPALESLAKASLTVGNKLGHDAYRALFMDTAADDPGIRQLQLEVAMVKRDSLSEVQPDLEYFNGAKPVARTSPDLARDDDWLKPAGP